MNKEDYIKIVNEKLKKELQTKANKILKLVEKGYNKIVFPDIINIKNILLKDKEE